jgi:hypothetical protein
VARRTDYRFERNTREKAKAAKREAKREAKAAARAEKKGEATGSHARDNGNAETGASNH